MRFFSKLPSYVSGMMIKMGSLPGLGFLQNYVFAARAMKYQFGDHAEDYEVYLSVGQDIIHDAKGPGKKSQGEATAAEGEDTDIYDDYEWGDTSAAYHPVDDYPTSDDQHRYYDDDYRAN
jgi:hypothetical protein